MTKVRDCNVRPSVCVPVSRTKRERETERDRQRNRGFAKKQAREQGGVYRKRAGLFRAGLRTLYPYTRSPWTYVFPTHSRRFFLGGPKLKFILKQNWNFPDIAASVVPSVPWTCTLSSVGRQKLFPSLGRAVLLSVSRRRTASIHTLTHFRLGSALFCPSVAQNFLEISPVLFLLLPAVGESGLESSALPWVIRLGFYVGLYNSPPSRRPSVAVQSLWFH